MTRPLIADVRSSRLSLVRVAPARGGAILPFMGADIAAHVRWMRQRGLSEATIRHRQKVLRMVANHAQRPLLDLTAEHLDAWQSTLGALSLETQRSYKVQVRGYFRWAVDRAHLLEHDPAAEVLIIPRVPRHLPRPVSERDLERALEQAAPPVRLWLELAAFAGLRAAEIAVLDRADVLDTAEPPMLVVHGKGGKMRAVPLAPRLLASLDAYGLPGRGRLFLINGRPVPPKRVSKLANDFLHRIGMPETIHKFRHRFATQALTAGGLNVRQVQELLGHESVESTAIYTWINPTESAAAVAAIDRPLLRPVQETGT